MARQVSTGRSAGWRPGQDYERLLLGEPYTKVNAMNKTVYEQGLEKGMEQGQLTGLKVAVQTLLQERFQVLPPGVAQRLQGCSRDRLLQLLTAIPKTSSLKELGLDD